MAYSIEDIESTTIAVGNDDEHYGHVLGIDGEPYPRVHITPQGQILTGDGTAAPTPITNGVVIVVPAGTALTPLLAALPSGSTLNLSPGDYPAFEVSKPNMRIVGSGGTGQDRQTGLGATRINAEAGGWAVRVGLDTGSEIFQGIELDHLNLVGHSGGTSLGGVWSGRVSNFEYTNLCASDFPAGHGYYIKGGPASQYGLMRDCDEFECLKGIEVLDHNGLVIDGGTSEYLTDDAVIIAGSFAVIGTENADSLRIINRIIQFKDTGADLLGENSYVGNCRFEATGNGIVLRGSQQVAGEGNSFNNTIVGSGGKSVVVINTAENATIHPSSYGSISSPPVTDNGFRTARLDAEEITFMLPLVNHVAPADPMEIPVYTIPTNLRGRGTFMMRYAELRVGKNTVAASGTDTYGAHFKKVTPAGTATDQGPDLNAVAGWAAYSVVPYDISLGPGDNVLNPGDTIRFDIAVAGNPADLSGASVSFKLVPY